MSLPDIDFNEIARTATRPMHSKSCAASSPRTRHLLTGCGSTARDAAAMAA